MLGTLGDALRVAFGEAVEERRFPFDVGSSAFRPCDERFEREALVDPIERRSPAANFATFFSRFGSSRTQARTRCSR